MGVYVSCLASAAELAVAGCRARSSLSRAHNALYRHSGHAQLVSDLSHAPALPMQPAGLVTVHHHWRRSLALAAARQA